MLGTPGSVNCSTAAIFNFCIAAEKQSVFVFVNNSAREYNVLLKGRYREYLAGGIYEKNMLIKPYSYGILAKIK